MEEFAALLSARRHDRRRRQLPTSRTRSAATALLKAARHQLRRCRHQRRHLGPGQRLRHDGRRRPRGRRAARADLQGARAARRRLRPLRPAGRRPLHQDGPQRHRVRADAGVRRGLRDPARVGVPARPGGGRQGLEARHGHPLVAAGAGRAAPSSSTARTWATSGAGSRTRARAAGRSRRRSTTTCPAPIITLSLLARFRSRQDESYSAEVLAALRNQFGGHAVKTE